MERSARAPWPISRRPGPADAAGFADGEIREIVVQDEFLFVLAAGVGIKFLHVVAGAERGERDGLGFAAGRKSPNHARAAGCRLRWKSGAPRQSRGHPGACRFPKSKFPNGFLLNVIKGVLDDKIGDLFRAEFFDELLRRLRPESPCRRPSRASLPGVSRAGTKRSPASFLASGQDFVGNNVERDFAFLLAAFATSSFCAAISGWQLPGRISTRH
jgi:hypothetical protein